jgi:hypothetical protein
MKNIFYQNSRLQIIKGENHGSYAIHSSKLFEIIKDFIGW